MGVKILSHTLLQYIHLDILMHMPRILRLSQLYMPVEELNFVCLQKQPWVFATTVATKWECSKICRVPSSGHQIRGQDGVDKKNIIMKIVCHSIESWYIFSEPLFFYAWWVSTVLSTFYGNL